MQKKTVAILFGGSNSEHEVSLMSATSVLTYIDRERFEVVMLGITKSGRWMQYSGPIEDIVTGAWESHPQNRDAIISPDRTVHGMLTFDGSEVIKTHIDVAFPVMHGRFAEDGTMQGLFELAGIPCVGPATASSAICMDKEFTHIVLDAAGIKGAKWVAIKKSAGFSLADIEAKIAFKLGGFPVFVKPANAGSSVGVTKVKSSDTLQAALDCAFEHDTKIIIEGAVVGREVEVAVMGNDSPVASTHLGEIVPQLEFYDYNSKYYDDTAKLYLPARVTPEETELVRETALRAYRALGCKGLTRMDFFLLEDGSCILNEPNTIPGFTHISMYPKLFIDSGLSYSELIDRLLDYAVQSC